MLSKSLISAASDLATVLQTRGEPSYKPAGEAGSATERLQARQEAPGKSMHMEWENLSHHMGRFSVWSEGKQRCAAGHHWAV